MALMKMPTNAVGGGSAPTLETTNLPRNTQFSEAINNGVVVASLTTDDSNIFYVAYFIGGVETLQYKHTNVAETYSNGTLELLCSYTTALNVRVFKID